LATPAAGVGVYIQPAGRRLGAHRSGGREPGPARPRLGH